MEKYFRRLYYLSKPHLPRKVRWAIRRVAAKRLRKKYASTWPVNEAAACKPSGWKGWPHGKQFSFLLSHDVESQKGVDNVRALAELEKELGFRSSFNFIPEGDYQVPEELRNWLVENGFEVGVHDLNHDGHLYDSRAGFREKAARINTYLKEWNAVGFRSGFMLRQLEWLHDLNILYDSSTFDTDPFEPQPDGANTIFPFMIRAGNESSSTYVELPYTLVQDSTLFLLLREECPTIWFEKLDWIAQNEGMAFVNVHPDYMGFAGKVGGHQYPVEYYREFLEGVRAKHDGQFWHTLPRELATFANQESTDQQQISQSESLV